jgi:hypothetical protein
MTLTFIFVAQLLTSFRHSDDLERLKRLGLRSGFGLRLRKLGDDAHSIIIHACHFILWILF